GCGKMGSAMLRGWLGSGLAPSAIWIIEPGPSDWLKNQPGLHLNAGFPDDPAIVLIAVKPQMIGAALPAIQRFGNGNTVFLSVAAGISMASYADLLGDKTPVIRAMPNTPAAIGQGITALIGNAHADASAMDMAEELMSAVGQTVRLQNESQMDAVTAVSGSGPAYVFHLIEALAAAGEAEGLTRALAMKLATATVAGAGALAANSSEPPAQLRRDVTSPGGTTEAALAVLMDGDTGLADLMGCAVRAAAARSRELGK
ncbi:MAG: pyrroline-5-carboxylate reductase, partial [Paracoccaceae bacterium]